MRICICRSSYKVYLCKFDVNYIISVSCFLQYSQWYKYTYMSYLNETSFVFADHICLCVFLVKNSLCLQETARDWLTLIMQVMDYAKFHSD